MIKKLILLASFFILGAGLNAQSVFLWLNENPSFHFDDPETGEYASSEDRITGFLDEMNINYDSDYELPEDLLQYDAVLVFLGGFCVS
ncbi:MAG: hypothetical protein CSB55_05500 [Candidatus Cloacimonadota bacterium]|nr:MAG: hypothetical protein CSB55_05500 [Candidatus Cloacimonadota bacterium]